MTLLSIEQVQPGVHFAGSAFFAAFFLAASDGAAEIATAITATAPTNRSLVKDFIEDPLSLISPENCTVFGPSQEHFGASAVDSHICLH
jgi:hypothetical protein